MGDLNKILGVINSIKDLDSNNDPEYFEEKAGKFIWLLIGVFVNYLYIQFLDSTLEFSIYFLLINFIFSFGVLKLWDAIWRSRPYNLSKERGLVDWHIQGNVFVRKDELIIKQSDLGMIIKDRLWEDVKLNFKFKIPKTNDGEQLLNRGFGVLYRASSLGKYYMLKIDKNGYQPHVRNVGWENNGIISIPTSKTLALNKWIEVKIVIKGDYLSAMIGKDKLEYSIQSHSVINRDTSNTLELENRPFTEVPFRSRGSIGFRCGYGEEVVIRDLLVTKLAH